MAYKGLYATLEASLRVHQKEQLFPKCRFAIANEQMGYYYLDDTTIKKVIRHFINKQNNFYSPIELTIWLTASYYPFQRSVSLQSFKNDKKPITIPFSANKYIQDAPEIVLATIALFNTENYTTKNICKVRGYFLNVVMPDDHSEDLIPIFDKYQEIFTQQFKSGIKGCSPFLKTLNAASESMSNTTVSDFIATVIAKLGAELIK